MSKKAIVYLIFFGVLFAVFYGVMMYTTDFAKVKLPVLNTVQHFSFLKQDSTMISEQQTQGKVYVVEYFFTSCRGICPKMNKNMKAIYERFKSASNFIVISHTVNPETDSKKASATLGISLLKMKGSIPKEVIIIQLRVTIKYPSLL